MKRKEKKATLLREEINPEDLGEALLLAQATHGKFIPLCFKFLTHITGLIKSSRLWGFLLRCKQFGAVIIW